MTESAYASEEHTTLKGPTAAACGCCVCGWRAHIRASARAGRYERRRARRSRAACGHTHARGTALSASTIDNPPRLCACRSIVCASAPVGQRQRRLHGVRCEGRPAAAQNLARERQSSSQQRAVRTQSRSSRSGTGRPACASSCSRRRPCTARGSTCCPTPPRPPRPCPAPARRRTPCRRAPRGRTIGPTRARGNEGTFFTIDAVRPRLLFSDLLPLLGPHPSGARPFGSEGRVARARGLPPAHAEACVAVWPALAWVFIRDSFNPIYR